MRRATGLGVLTILTVLIWRCPVRAGVSRPRGVVGAFCYADAQGLRVRSSTWPQIAALVSWSLEPAWDHIVLITGYQIGVPRIDGDVEAVDVTYDATGEVTGYGLDPETFTETVTYRLHPSADVGWRLDGPPPPPHLFADDVDVVRMRRSLARGGLNFITDSGFVWQRLRATGLDVDFERTSDLLNAPAYRPVRIPQPGDLVVYLRDGAPYHVGVLEAANRVVSSTLNAGVVVAALDAFAGEVRYLRPMPPVPVAVPMRAAAVERGTGGRALTVRPRHTPTPATRRGRRTPARHPTPASRHGVTPERRPSTRRPRPRRPRPVATPTPR